MTVDTITINGTITLPDDTSVRGRTTVTFRLTGFDTDATYDAVVAPREVVTRVSSAGVMTPVDLWSNTDGVRQTLYQVTLNLYDDVDVDLGKIQVPTTGGPYDLNDLLPIAPPAGATVAQYIAELQAASAAAVDAAADVAADAADAEAAAAAALVSETNAAASAAAAATSETNASASASAAATSETNAATSETNAASSAAAALVSEGNAATSEANAATSETNAATSETNAATSETNAAASEAAALAAQTATEAAYDDFDDRYLGPKAADPTLDNDGDALTTGALYFNTVSNQMKVYDGAAWQPVAVVPGDFLQVSNNLSDLANAATARTNLGIEFASQVEAEAGTDDTKYMNPLRTAQAIAALAGGGGGETAVTLTPAATVNIDASLGTIFTLSMDQDTDITVSGADSADAFHLVLTVGGSGYDIGGASYDSVSFSVAGQDSNPLSIAFKPDGTKMYMLGITTDTVYQYSLGTAWDLSTASYDSVSFSVAGQDSNPRSISFKPDGTKMYMLGITTDTVYQYSLGTAWDLSTASYDSVSFSVAGQDGVPISITFKPDGTKMYMLGNSTDTVYQYSLGTAWDLSTASYDSVSFSVTGQDGVPISITFKPDGTKMYMVGNTTDTVYQYSLGTAWDLSTASYDSVSFSVTGQDGNPFSIAFKPDGTKMYMLGDTTDTVYQYTTGVSFTVTYPASLKWPGGLPPSTPSAGETDVIKAITVDTGTTWLAWQEGDNFS